jgi:hypothetical protein
LFFPLLPHTHLFTTPLHSYIFNIIDKKHYTSLCSGYPDSQLLS